jgi:hypothetical protein
MTLYKGPANMTFSEIRNEFRKLFEELEDLQRERDSESSERSEQDIDEQADIVRQCIIDTAAWCLDCEVTP